MEHRDDVSPSAGANARGRAIGPEPAPPHRATDVVTPHGVSTAPGERAQRAAALEQRHALASEVHDSVMQTLFSLHLAAQVAWDSWERDPAQARAALEVVLRLTGDVRAEMRTLLFELRENVLASDGLAGALERYVELMAHQSDLRIDLQLHGSGRLPRPYQEILYRLAREGLANAAKHAQAQHTSVVLRVEQDEVRLRVEDDGVGFLQAEPEGASCGLRLLRERVQALGGALSLGNCPQGGAYLEVTLPPPEEP